MVTLPSAGLAFPSTCNSSGKFLISEREDAFLPLETVGVPGGWLGTSLTGGPGCTVRAMTLLGTEYLPS